MLNSVSRPPALHDPPFFRYNSLWFSEKTKILPTALRWTLKVTWILPVVALVSLTMSPMTARAQQPDSLANVFSAIQSGQDVGRPVSSGKRGEPWAIRPLAPTSWRFR